MHIIGATKELAPSSTRKRTSVSRVITEEQLPRMELPNAQYQLGYQKNKIIPGFSKTTQLHARPR